MTPNPYRPKPPVPRRRVIVAAVLAAALVAGAGPTAAARPAPRPPTPPVLDWTDCGDGLECATASVPLDYSRPDRKHIELAVIRRPATDPTRRIGSIFVSNGGPGNSVLEFVRGDAQSVLSAEVHARFDIVGFDPRGVGESTPVRCFADAEAQQAFFAQRPPFPVTPDEIDAFTAGSRELGRRCRQINGELLEHLSTANVARDMDLLRQAVGDTQLTFAGYSYGGLLGITYANLFPNNVRALVLDGLPDPVEWTRTDAPARGQTLAFRIDSPQATSATMGAFLDSCHAAGPGCAFAGPDTTAKFDTLMARLQTGPIAVELPDGPFVVTYAFLADALRGAMQFPPIWPELAGNLEAVFQASEGAAGEASIIAGSSALSVAADGYDNRTEAQMAVVCSETRGPGSPGRWPALAAEADEVGPYFGSPWTYQLQPSATWPARDRDRFAGPFTAQTAHPVLFVNARLDPASDYQRAAATAAALPGARLLTLDGPAHPASFVPNTCITGHIDAYLLAQQLPAEGATCQPEFEPFG